MGRKRLMTVLAAVVAVAGLQAAPATAQGVGLPGVGEVSVERDLGISVEAELDVEVTEDVKVDPKLKAKVDDDPAVETGGGVKVGDTEIALEAPKPPAPAPETPAPDPTPDASDDDADDAAAGKDKDDKATAGDRERAERRVQAAGDGSEWTPRRQAQLEAFRALRDHDAAFASASASSVVPGVELAPRRSASFGDGGGDLSAGVAQPQVAPHVSAAEVRPEVASAVAATPASLPTPNVPLPLQALAAVLVAGAAMSWNLTRRELGWAFSGLRRN